MARPSVQAAAAPNRWTDRSGICPLPSLEGVSGRHGIRSHSAAGTRKLSGLPLTTVRLYGVTVSWHELWSLP
jgi:hypothetical protein